MDPFLNVFECCISNRNIGKAGRRKQLAKSEVAEAPIEEPADRCVARVEAKLGAGGLLS